MYKTHSEIRQMLDKHQLSNAHLTSPPKAYLATLVDETTNATHSVRFQIPDTNPDMPGEPMVIHTLLSRLMPFTKIIHAELQNSTLEYFLEENTKDATTKVSGSQIRYTVVGEETQKRNQRNLGNQWKFLPDTIHLHLAHSVPWTVDNDTETVNKNIEEAKTILVQQIADLGQSIEKIIQKKSELQSSLDTILTD